MLTSGTDFLAGFSEWLIGRKEKSTLYLILSVQLYSHTTVCFSPCLSHAGTYVSILYARTSVEGGLSIIYILSNQISLCFCGLALQLVSKTFLFTAENIVWLSAGMKNTTHILFRSIHPCSVLHSRNERCLTETNSAFLKLQ